MLLKEISPEAFLPTSFGVFRIRAVRDAFGVEHAVLIKGDIEHRDSVALRIHSECLTGDAFSSERCDCRNQLALAMSLIENEGSGLIIYLRQEGRGIGLFDKVRAYHLQDEGVDTVDANTALGLPVDRRNYGLSAEIIAVLHVRSVKLMTNNPLKREALVAAGIGVREIVPLLTEETANNARYLDTKRRRLGHTL